MPIVEVDVLIAFVNALDKYHEAASRLLKEVTSGKIKNVKVAASAYLEYALILRSKGYDEEEIREDLIHFRNMPNLGEAPLNVDVLIRASKLRKEYNLTFFDSLHAATALMLDKVIISVDQAYKRIKGLKVIDPSIACSIN